MLSWLRNYHLMSEKQKSYFIDDAWVYHSLALIGASKQNRHLCSGSVSPVGKDYDIPWHHHSAVNSVPGPVGEKVPEQKCLFLLWAKITEIYRHQLLYNLTCIAGIIYTCTVKLNRLQLIGTCAGTLTHQ